MPVRIRLQRHGKKGKPFYWVVAADSRAKRDGKFLEKLGTYNPNTNPATIELDVDGSVKWLQNGAQPSDTARAILSYKGVMLKHHLLTGLNKGALTEDQVEERFQAWLKEKQQKIQDKVDGLDKARQDARTKALEAERKVNEERLAALAPEPEVEEAEGEAEAAEAPTQEAVAEEAPAEAAVAEEAPAEAAETEKAPAKEAVAEEAPAEKEAAAAEEAPAEEPKAEKEAPASEETPADSEEEKTGE